MITWSLNTNEEERNLPRFEHIRGNETSYLGMIRMLWQRGSQKNYSVVSEGFHVSDMEAETVYMRESHSYFPMSRWKRKTQGAEVWKKMVHFAFEYYFLKVQMEWILPACMWDKVFSLHFQQISLDIMETWVYFIYFYNSNTFIHWSLVVKAMITFNVLQYRMFILSAASFNILFKIFKRLVILLALLFI